MIKSGDSVPDAFTSVERNAILETVKSDDTYNYVDSREPIVFDAYENILNGDKVFYLSAEEAESSKYGNPSETQFFDDWFLRSYINANFVAFRPGGEIRYRSVISPERRKTAPCF